MCITDTSFIIPRQIEDVKKELRPNFERAKSIILRMDEYIVSSEEQNRIKQFYHHNISHGFHALAKAA
ncbi:unnamed protein product, partial [Rotaria magnacalcarata]